MDFPKRIKTHISESRSFDIVSKSLPDEWIIREITERDYGIDLYVEIIGDNGLVTGDLVALQVKSTKAVHFNGKGKSTLSGIKRTTLNYWIGLPVPVFVLLVDLSDEKVYWCNIDSDRRLGYYKGDTFTFSLKFNLQQDASKTGINLFILTYIREKRWPDIENSIEKSLMSYNNLGPLMLMCSRQNSSEICTTTIQYLLIQHYEYYTTLSRYLLCKKPKYLPEWYERNLQIHEESGANPTLNFSYQLVKEMLDYFIGDYRDCIICAYEMVTNSQRDYFFSRMPYLSIHLKLRPHTFLLEDWYARYYYDEYEDETQHPEKLFFDDFSEFDDILEETVKT
ncbi:DUF4365 domain-containing protein [Shewanella frigidimarina]|uniref:DUF4365 domain-containing protein n=1 Tax=Shewanella frigidimarina TaxID=56812 RepID=UPI000F5170F5|nr:DUF4365 domain-containing protein [Shewanella frigidimarina]RPA30936.1 DUF4365 domain-containing protein [Shewanella frigidimarina]